MTGELTTGIGFLVLSVAVLLPMLGSTSASVAIAIIGLGFWMMIASRL
jgi:hypothetical protein